MYACARRSRHARSHDFTTLSKVEVEVSSPKWRNQVQREWRFQVQSGGGGIKSKVEESSPKGVEVSSTKWRWRYQVQGGGGVKSSEGKFLK